MSHIDLGLATKNGRPVIRGQMPAARPSMGELAARENFPVAARILPARLRLRLQALYSYARMVDDIGDEAPPAERAGLLDAVERDLGRVYAGSRPRTPVMRQIAHLAHTCGIPRASFQNLIEANRRDQEVTRYATYGELLDYCALSANPVGRIVLHIFGAATPRAIERSDQVCTALQIIEHLQDVGEDLTAKGRIYLPAEDMRRFGVTEPDLAAADTPTRLRGLVAFEANRAAALLDEGAPMVSDLHGWARLTVSGYVAGGRATLAALRREGHDVLREPIRPAKTRLLAEWPIALARR